MAQAAGSMAGGAAAGQGANAGGDFAHYSDTGLVICLGRTRWAAALGEVHHRHGGAAHDLAARICGPDRAEDVVAGVMVELWRAPERFDPDRSSLRGYLLGQAHARAAHIAQAARRAGAPGNPPAAARGIDADPAPAHSVEEHAGRFLGCLPEDEANVVALAYLGGLSCTELAVRLKQPKATVARRIRSGLMGLRQGSTSLEASF